MPKGVEMTGVVSSMVAAIGYDEENDVLYVEFNTGPTYAYEGVPKDEFENLRDASSVGSYFNQNIKGSYRGRKL